MFLYMHLSNNIVHEHDYVTNDTHLFYLNDFNSFYRTIIKTDIYKSDIWRWVEIDY